MLGSQTSTLLVSGLGISFFKQSLLYFIVCVLLWQSGTTCECWFSPSATWSPGIKSRSSSLKASPFPVKPSSGQPHICVYLSEKAKGRGYLCSFLLHKGHLWHPQSLSWSPWMLQLTEERGKQQALRQKGVKSISSWFSPWGAKRNGGWGGTACTGSNARIRQHYSGFPSPADASYKVSKDSFSQRKLFLGNGKKLGRWLSW